METGASVPGYSGGVAACVVVSYAGLLRWKRRDTHFCRWVGGSMSGRLRWVVCDWVAPNVFFQIELTLPLFSVFLNAVDPPGLSSSSGG